MTAVQCGGVWWSCSPPDAQALTTPTRPFGWAHRAARGRRAGTGAAVGRRGRRHGRVLADDGAPLRTFHALARPLAAEQPADPTTCRDVAEAAGAQLPTPEQLLTLAPALPDPVLAELHTNEHAAVVELTQRCLSDAADAATVEARLGASAPTDLPGDA